MTKLGEVMNLDDALAATDRPAKRVLLAERVLNEMAADGKGADADALRKLIVDTDMTTYRLSRMFGLLGYSLGETPIGNMRKRYSR